MCTFGKFEEDVRKSNGLICYGAGKQFQRFIEQYSKSDILQYLLYCTDVNEELQNTKIKIQDRYIPIYSLQALQNMEGQNKILLITNLYFSQVINELKKRGYLKNIKYYCYAFMRVMSLEEEAMGKKIPPNLRITSKPVIPKKIHYCWFGNSPIPERYQKFMESWKRFCPDYEIIQWDESNYDIKKNAYMYEAYQCRKWGFVPDYARLDIIYEHGGIYLDTDVELVQNLDDMLYQRAYAGFETKEYVALGLGFGAEKGMPLIAEMRECYEKRHFIDKFGTPNLTASPVYQTEFLVGKGLVQNGEYQRIGDMVIYPEKILSGKSVYGRRIRLTPYTKSIHHYDATWSDEETKEKNELLEQEMNENPNSSAMHKYTAEDECIEF